MGSAAITYEVRLSGGLILFVTGVLSILRIFAATLEQTRALPLPGNCRSGKRKMLNILVMLAGPILVITIVMIVVFEIRDAWNRNRLSK
jgi:hypothetical protein